MLATRTFAEMFRPRAIVGALPVTLTNGTTADATQIMSDLNWIVNQVNANAAPLASVALINANNNFTTVQSGTAASAAANFPIASQVQNQVFNTLSSTLGTNAITARVAALALGAYVSGQVFTFIPQQTNTGPANITIDAAGSGIIFSMGSTLIGGELRALVPAIIERDATKFNLLNPSQAVLPRYTMSLGADMALNNTANYFDGPSVAQGTIGTWYVSGTVLVHDTAVIAEIYVKLWDGTTVIASGQGLSTSAGASYGVSVSLSGYITAPAGNLRMSARDVSSMSGQMAFNTTGNSKDSTITAIRIA